MSGEVSPAASEVSAISQAGEEKLCVKANDNGMETIYMKYFCNQRSLFEHRDFITPCDVEFLYAPDGANSDEMPLFGHSFMLDWRFFAWRKFCTTTSGPNKFVVDLSSFNRNTVKALLRFVYCFDLQIKRVNIASLFKLLDKFSDPAKTDSIVDHCLTALQEALGDSYLSAIADPEIPSGAAVIIGEEVESGIESSAAKPSPGVIGPAALTADETRSIFGGTDDVAFAGGGNTPATPILFDTPATVSVGEHGRRQVDAFASYASPFESSTPFVPRRVNDEGINRALDSWTPVIAEARRANEELGISVTIDDFAQDTVRAKIAEASNNNKSNSVGDLVSDSEGENPREDPPVNGDQFSAHVESYLDDCFGDSSAADDDVDNITLLNLSSSDSEQSDDEDGGAKGTAPRRAASAAGRGNRRRGRRRRGHGWSSLGRTSARTKSGGSEPKVAKPRRSQSVSSSCRSRVKKVAPVGQAVESRIENQPASDEIGRGSRRRSRSGISYYESPPSSPKSARGNDSSDDDDLWEDRRPPSRGRSATPRLQSTTGYRTRLRSRGSVKDSSEQEPEEMVSSDDEETERGNGHNEDEEASKCNGDKQSRYVQSTAGLTSIMNQLKDCSVIIPHIDQTNLDSSPNALLAAAAASEFVAPEEIEDANDSFSAFNVTVNSVAHGSFQYETPEASGKTAPSAMIRKPNGPRLALGQEILKFQNVTPAPNYAQMPTPMLKRALKDNGVRPLPKAKGIIVLNEIYKKNHPVLDEATGSLSELTPEVMKPKPAEKRKRGPRKKTTVNVGAESTEPNSDGAAASVGFRLGGGGATAESSLGGPKVVKAKRQRKPKPAPTPAQPQPHLYPAEYAQIIAQTKLTEKIFGKRTRDDLSDESNSDDDGMNNSGCADTELNQHGKDFLDLLRNRTELSAYYSALQSGQRVELRALHKDLAAAEYKISLELLADILDVSGHTYKLDGQRGRYKKLVKKRRGNVAETQQGN